MKQNISNCYRCHAVSKSVLTAKITAANVKLTNLILEQEGLLFAVASFSVVVETHWPWLYTAFAASLGPVPCVRDTSLRTKQQTFFSRNTWPLSQCQMNEKLFRHSNVFNATYNFLRFFVTCLKINVCTDVTYNFVERVHHHFDLVNWRTSSIICSGIIILHDDNHIC